jgi:hypothetical protein
VAYLGQVNERVVSSPGLESSQMFYRGRCQAQLHSFSKIGRESLDPNSLCGRRRASQINRWVPTGVAVMTYVMTKPCPVCKQQLTKKTPTETLPCACGKHVWQG